MTTPLWAANKNNKTSQKNPAYGDGIDMTAAIRTTTQDMSELNREIGTLEFACDGHGVCFLSDFSEMSK